MSSLERQVALPQPDRTLRSGARRWPHGGIAVALGCLLVIAYLGPLWLTCPPHEHAIAMAVAVVLATAARLLYEAPPSSPATGGPAADLPAALRAATGAALLVGCAAAALGWPLQPLAPLLAWVTGFSILLLAPQSASRAQAIMRTGCRLFFVGTPDQLGELRGELVSDRHLKVVGQLTEEGVACDRLRDQVETAGATLLILSEEALRSPTIVEAAAELNLLGVRVRDLRGFYERQFGKVAVNDLTLSWFLFDIAAIHRRRGYGSLKRLIEALVATTVLIASIPILPAVVLAIKLSSPGPVLFRQRRVGRGGELFTLTKFRTMHSAPGDAPGEWAGASQARVFAVGRLLRRLRLDELPQLVAVARGDLSLVGPRPEQPEIAARLAQAMRYYNARHVIRPGLTGWAQVNLGYAGSEAGSLAKLQYDLFYIKHQGLGLDLRIMAATAGTILFGSGS